MREARLLVQTIVAAVSRVRGRVDVAEVKVLARQLLPQSCSLMEVDVDYEVMNPRPVHRLAADLQCRGLSGYAIVIVARLFRSGCAASQVFLEDLAEWSMISPIELRSLREEAHQLAA